MSEKKGAKMPLVKIAQCEICWSDYAGPPTSRYCRKFGDACARIGAARRRAERREA